MAENTAIPIRASNKSNGASQGIYDNRVRDNRDIFFKFSLFFMLWIRKFRLEKIQNKHSYILNFPDLFYTIILVLKIQAWEFKKIMANSLPYFYAYPGPSIF